MGLYDMIDNDVKSHFVSETNRKSEAIDELLVKINKAREKLEEHMSGSKKSDDIYDTFDKIIGKLNNMKDECETTNKLYI